MWRWDGGLGEEGRWERVVGRVRGGGEGEGVMDWWVWVEWRMAGGDEEGTKMRGERGGGMEVEECEGWGWG